MAATLNGFNPVPSWQHTPKVTVDSGSGALNAATGVLLGPGEAAEGLSPDALASAGFKGQLGQTLVLPRAEGPPVILTGLGENAGTKEIRDAAAAFALAARGHSDLALTLPAGEAQAAVEGVLLARYDYSPLKKSSGTVELHSLTLRVRGEQAELDAKRGAAFASATALARDLANAPPSRLTAARMAECAAEIAGATGLQIEVFDKEALIELGCGGLLGVNAGSADPPRMIRLRYKPEGSEKHLILVGKGVMYDSGGIALKPADAVHATMKNDMSGAGAILAAMSMLSELDCPLAVTGYLMCTDNMPSGTALKMGDVISIHGGKTVEVINTDAEGRLVMADALVMAVEEKPDAIVDIATLTGACLRTLGPEVAGLLGNNSSLMRQIETAAVVTDEPVWQLPLDHRYRDQLDSDIADLKNMGGINAGSITAALFLEEFVGKVPWAHLDIAGTAQNDVASLWRTKGCTGFGARLLLELALTFQGQRS